LPDISQEELAEYKWLFENKFSKNHIIALGINNQTTINNSLKYFNTFSIYDHELNLINSYNKIKLVPFGEFLPLENFLSIIGLKSITNNYQSYSKGNKREIIEIKRKDFPLKILPLICYEIIYSGEIFKENDFDLIINISEDGWFGKSIGPKQHFAHSIFRSIESGKYTIRSANNGTSAVINPIGVIEKSLDSKENGYIDLEKRKKIQPTVFSEFGNKIFGYLILLYIFFIFSISFGNSLNRNKTNFNRK
jgi:apolipoprotein N-acyltransferase